MSSDIMEIKWKVMQHVREFNFHVFISYLYVKPSPPVNNSAADDPSVGNGVGPSCIK